VFPTSKKTAFSNRLSHPLFLHLILLKDLGKDYTGWMTSTIWTEVFKTFGGATVVEANKQKIQALKVLMTAPTTSSEWEIFEKVVVGLSGSVPAFDLLQVPSLQSVAVAVEIYSRLTSRPFTTEIWKYIAAVCLEEGVLYAPGKLEPANQHILKLSGVTYQDKVRTLVRSGKRLPRNLNDAISVQVGKSNDVLDFVAMHRNLLLKQIGILN
jgi:hypothetical protein